MFRLLAVVLAFLGLTRTLAGSGAADKTFTVQKPEGADSAEQVIQLKGVTMPAGVDGVRVYVNPGKGEKLGEQNKAYVGTVFSSHREPGKPSTGDFVLMLPEKVSGPAQVVVEPVRSQSAGMAAPEIQVSGVAIKSAAALDQPPKAEQPRKNRRYRGKQ